MIRGGDQGRERADGCSSRAGFGVIDGAHWGGIVFLLILLMLFVFFPFPEPTHKATPVLLFRSVKFIFSWTVATAHRSRFLATTLR
jgi:hypothetical protein